MAKTSNVIELNGKQYNALTGELLSGGAKPATYAATVKPLPVQLKPQPSIGVSVDGMLGASKPTPHHAVLHKKAPTAAHQAKQIPHRQPEHSKTLMRHAVKAPVIKQKVATKTLAPLHKSLPAKLAVKPKLSSDVIDPSRTKRAQTINHSPMVRRFNSAPAPITHHKPAQPALKPAVAATPAPAATAAKPPQLTVIHHQAAQTRPRPRSLDIRRPMTASAQPARPQASSSKALFENAIANATSHEQPRPAESSAKKLRRGARRRSRLLSISAAAAVLVLLVGFIAYQNRANLELQLASAKAGFHVSTPGYNPGGFALGKISYSPGAATLAYSSSAGASFAVTQKQSNWDSQTLLDNYVATAGDSYQGYQANGRTVYVYGQGNATWVNGGIWYQIRTNNTSLSSDQLVKIAASM